MVSSQVAWEEDNNNNQVRSGLAGKTHGLWAVNRSDGDGVVLLAVQGADLLLELDVVDVLSFPRQESDIKQMKLRHRVTFSLKINLPEHCSSLYILYLNMKLSWQLP